jgi:16S rRNA processing protein RimM
MSPEPGAKDDTWVPLAEIARPHGVRGELRLRLFNASSDLLLDQREVLVRRKDGAEHEARVERARRADEAILMKLREVDDRDRADELRGGLVCIRRRDFPPPDDGEFYAVDIVGAEARVNGERLGEIIELVTYPTASAIVVRPSDGLGDWEIPLTDAYIAKLDLASRVVEVSTLEDLERPQKKKPKEPRPPRRPRGAKPGGTS